MKTMTAAKFEQQCLAVLDRVEPEGLVITKRGKPVARLLPFHRAPASLIGALRGKLTLDLDDPEVVRVLAAIHVWPLDPRVAKASTRLDFRGYPADELIAATSVVHGVRSLTRDRTIRRSKLVPLA